MSAQYIVALASSLTTAAVLAMLRVVVNGRKALTQLVTEHRFLMKSMMRVLRHLDLEDKSHGYGT